MRKQRGFTLIELLIVVAIIGIIAAIAIPNLLDAIERSRQKRSTAEIKTLATAAQEFSVDFGGYMAGALAPANPAALWPTIVNHGGTTVVIPDLIQAVPPEDGWKAAYWYQDGLEVATPAPVPDSSMDVTGQHFCLWSYGNDKVASFAVTDVGGASGDAIATAWCNNPPVASGALHTHCYMTDIVWADSSFAQSPEGKQQNCN